MEALARLGLFGFAYITVYIISNLVARTNEQSSPTILENFHGVSFLLVTIVYKSPFVNAVSSIDKFLVMLFG